MSSPLRNLQTKIFERVNPLVGFSVSRYVFSIGIFLGLVIFGIVATRSLGVDQLPTVSIPVVSVMTPYPGAAPDIVDTDVTQTIEGAVAGIAGITEIDSTSRTGSSNVTILFDQGSDQNANVNKIAAAVAGVRGLPSTADTPTVRTFNPNSQPILEFGIQGGRDSLENVYEYADTILLPQLQQIPGVAEVDINGGAHRQFQVLLNPDRLAAYHLSPQQVTSAISGSNLNASIGSITTQGTTVTYTTRSQPNNLADISAIVIDGAKNVRVSDVATVKDASSIDSYTRINGKPVVLISMQQTSGSNAVAVVNSVEAALKATKFPSGYSYTVSNDTTTTIRDAISNTTRELITTVLVVAVIVLLFLGRVNTAFSVIFAIPISLAASPILYSLFGFTLNQISLLAMIVAIGIVVDDSIVVAENVERYRELGMERNQAVLRGASEVFSAVSAASLSLLAVLIPVSFVGGFIGAYLQQFTLGLAAAVLLSWLEALLFLTVRMAYTPDAEPVSWRRVPRSFTRFGFTLRWGLKLMTNLWVIVLGLLIAAALWRFLGPVWVLLILLYPLALALLNYLVVIFMNVLEALSLSLNAGTERVLGFVRDNYVRALAVSLPRSGLILLGSLLFLVLTVVLAVPHISFQFVPQSDNGTFNVRVRLPRGTSLTAANEYTARVENYLLGQRYVKTVQSHVGGPMASVQVTLVPFAQRPNVYTLLPVYQSGITALFADHPDVTPFVSGGGGFRGAGGGSSGGNTASVTLVSASNSLLATRVNDATTVLSKDPDVLSVDTGQDNTNLENDFIPNQSQLSAAGLSASTVASTMAGYAAGASAGNVTINGLAYPIEVQIDPARLVDEDSLLSLPVYSSTLNTNIPAGSLGTFVQGTAPNSIARTNRLYSSTLTVQLSDSAPDSTAFLQQAQTELTQAGVLDNQVTLGSGGAFSAQALGSQLSVTGLQVFALGLLLVYLVMGSQFNSFRYPVYLLLPVPFAVAGAIWALFLTGTPLDVFSLLGFLLLIGLSAKNAILYLEFVVDRLKEMTLRDALIESSGLRFRPIIMTTLTVLVISLPLILGRGEGSEYNKSIGITILGGVLVSAVMTFFVVPAAFYFFERRRAGVQEGPQPAPRRAPRAGLPSGGGK